MVKLNKIYTRTGDDGTTGLGSGDRVPKTDLRIEAYGTVDELSSVLGLCVVALGDDHDDVIRLQRIQNDLFDLGADLAVPLETAGDAPRIRVGQARIDALEAWIDAANASLQPLTSFILPGGNVLAAWLHLGRTVCRRAERATLRLAERDALNPLCAVYLNRLSDLLFVLARAAAGDDEVLWVPTKEQG